MQLKLGLKEALPNTDNSTSQYRILVFCNKCGGTHEMGVSIILKDGPVEKQSIGQVYKDRNLPESLAKLSRMSITCPVTGRESYRRTTIKYF